MMAEVGTAASASSAASGRAAVFQTALPSAHRLVRGHRRDPVRETRPELEIGSLFGGVGDGVACRRNVPACTVNRITCGQRGQSRDQRGSYDFVFHDIFLCVRTMKVSQPESFLRFVSSVGMSQLAYPHRRRGGAARCHAGGSVARR